MSNWKATLAAGIAALAVTSGPTNATELAIGKVGVRSDLGDMKPYCGSKEIRVALSVGWGGNSWFKIAKREFELEAAKCPNIIETTYTDAQGNPEKQIADVQSLAAEGYDVIIVFPGAGEALVKAMRDATESGSVVVPFATGTNFPGKPGKDYLLTVTDDNYAEATLMAEWLVKQLNGKGNVVMYGGTPGNTLTASELAAVKDVFANHPDMKLLEDPIVTNWVAADYTTTTTAVLAKYPQIDAIFADFGLGVMGALNAFKTAGRPLPLLVSQDANELACFYEENKAKEPGFKVSTINYSGPWMAAWALRKGVAAVQDIDNLEPTIIKEIPAEDSTVADMQPKCFRDLPPDALPSNTNLTTEQLKELFK